MSQKNVELVRRGFEAWNRRDAAAGRELVATDVEWEPSTIGVIEKGLDGFVDAARALWEVWDDFHFEETEIRDWGDKVLWLGHADAMGSTGQVVLDQEFAVYFTIRVGKISRMQSYLSYARAFEAAGLPAVEGSHAVVRAMKPEAAWGAVQLGFAEILDLRTGIERRRHGAPPGARRVSLAKHIASPEGPGAIYLCQHAIRSKATLRHGAAEVAGGFAAWKQAGLPVEEVD
jgi:ketosteroid isomerase-like protein/rhodanese-related sulfurtransferase